MKSFVATVGPPYPDESLMGYLNRALSVTFVDNLPAALRIADAAKPNVRALATTLQSETEIDRLSHLVGCKPSDIATRTYRTSSDSSARRMLVIDFFGTKIRRRYRDALLRRVSPRALQAAPYHRAMWELRIFSCDLDTRERLLDTCPVCERPLGWIQAFGPTVCDKCVDGDGFPTVDLRDFEQPMVEFPDEEAVEFAMGLVHPDPARKETARRSLPEQFREFSNSALFEAVIAMAFGISGDRDGRPRVSVKDLVAITPETLGAAARAIIGGQAGFDALCERFRQATGTRAGHHGRIKELGYLAGLSNSQSPLHPQIRAVFRDMIESNVGAAVAAELGAAAEELTFLSRDRLASELRMRPGRLHSLLDQKPGVPLRPLPISRLASQFGIRPERLRRLSRSGSVPVVRAEETGKVPVRMAVSHVAPIVRHLPDALRPHQVSIKVGLPIYAVHDLAEHGLIKRLEDPVASMLGTDGAYSKSSVETLIAKLKEAACKRASGERITLAATRIRTGTTPWGAIVKAVLDNPSAIALDPKLKTFRLRNLQVIDPASFTRAVRRHLTTEEAVDKEWIGPAEAAELLKITYALFWRLVRARPDLIKPRRDGSRPYLVTDIQAISETYIFVSEVAFRRELHPRLAVAWLQAMGVKPEFSVRAKQDLVYRRQRVEPLLQRWNLKDEAAKTKPLQAPQEAGGRNVTAQKLVPQP